MTTRSTQITGVVLSAIMVLSMVAIAFTAGVGATSTGETVESTDAGVDEAVTADIATDSDVLANDFPTGPATIEGGLLDEADDGPVTAIVRVVRADRGQLATGDRDTVVDQLQAHADATQEPVLEVAAGHEGVEVSNTLWIANAVVVEADADGLEALAEAPGVDRIHPNHEYTLPDVEESGDLDVSPDQDVTYGLDQINAPDVWDEFDNQGEGATVTILDTGVDPDHPDMPDMHPDDQWQEFDDNGNPVPSDPFDDNGHGQHVSGTVVGSDDPDADVPAFGVAPEAELYHGKVLDAFGGGTFAQVAAGMEWSVDEFETDIVGMSLGGGASNTDLLEPAEHIWDAGMILVASNGNNALGAPGTYWSSFGSQAVDENEQPASFAVWDYIEPDSFFPGDIPDHWPEEYLTPHASAAGVGVLSAEPGSGHTQLSGTSMSQPHHAGMFALMVAQAGDEFDHVELRQIAMNETRDPPSDDPIFGQGISDAYLAVDEVGPPVPEHDVGDVNEDGEITVVDAVLIQQHLAGNIGENVTFNENLADVNRNEEISIVDAVLIQQYLAGIIDGAHADVHSLDAPEEAADGETITVNATVENTGGLGTIQIADMRLADADDPLDVNATVASEAVDLAPQNFDGNYTQLSMEMTPSEHGAGDMHLGMFSKHANQTAELFVTSPFFEVTDIDAPEEVVSGNEMTVEATIENTGTEADTQDVHYQFDGETMLTEEDVHLEPDESTTLTFEPFVDVDPDTYEHGVVTEDDGLFANITVTESVFDVSDVDGPAEVVHGDEITVTATIENIGDAADEQEIVYELGGGAPGPVAVVTPEGTSRDHGDRFLNFFADTLEEHDEDWEFHWVSPQDLDDDIDVMDDYESFVINRFGHDAAGVDGDDLADDFLDNLDDNQGVVYLGAHTGATDETYPDAIERLNNVRTDPGVYDSDSNIDDEKAITIDDDHPIWTDVGDVGDTVDMFGDIGGSFGYGDWFDDYSGDVLGHLDFNDESAVAVSDDGQELLWGSGGETFFTWDSDTDALEDRTDAGGQLLVNMVEYAQTGQVTGEDTTASDVTPFDRTQTLQLDPGESETVEFTTTVTADDGIGDMFHLVSSDDDSDIADVTVTAPDQIEITDYVAPAEAQQTDEVEVDVDLEHVGTETTTQNVEFTFGDGLIEQTETVTMDPDDTETVTFDITIPETLEPGDYDHNVSVTWDEESGTMEVLEGDEAFFEVSDFDAPLEAGQHDTFNVSATVENIGDFEETQTIEYDFNVDVDPPGDDPPELDDVDVAVVDTDLETDEDLTAELRERGLSEEEIDQHLDDVELDQMNDFSAMLASELDDDTYNLHNISSADLMDHTDMDVYVISQFDTVDVQDFLDEISDDTGLVHLDQWSSAQADGIEAPHNELGDPGEWTTDLNFGADYFAVDILEDHPVFDGVGDVGDEVPLAMDPGDGAAFDDFSGETVGDFVWEGEDDPLGGYVGINDDMNQVLLSASARVSFVPHDDFTEDEHTLVVNSIEYAAEQALLDGASISEKDDIATDDQPIQISATEDVTLDGGESVDVEFEFEVPGNLREDTYGHGVFSDDDDAVDEIFIFEQSPNIKVTGHFPEDDELEVGEELVTEAIVVNDGDVAGEKDIRLNVDGAVEDTVTVELDPDEVAQVELSTTMNEAGDFVVSVNGQDPQVVTVSDDGGDALGAASTAPGVPTLG